MNETVKNYFRELFSFSSSLATHLLLLLSITSHVLPFEIKLEEEETKKIMSLGGNNEESENSFSDDYDLFIDLDSFKQTKKNIPQKINNAAIMPARRKNNVKIDQRGIYKGMKGAGQGVGNGQENGKSATLNLPGWTWDSQPVVNDRSNEVGKIVFQFTIDDLGYVIGIQTIEKTVSNYVEKLYRDAVLNLTFKKIDKVKPQEETIGKITFIIQYSE